jgi:hypothetical protein
VFITERLKSARDSSIATVPVGYDHGLRRWFTVATGMVVILLLDFNARMIHRFGPELPAVWDTKSLPWVAELEAAYPEIRGELEAYLRSAGELPEVARFALASVDNRELYALPHADGSWAWRVKRMAPERFYQALVPRYMKKLSDGRR